MNLLNKIVDKFHSADWDDIIMFFVVIGAFVVLPIVGIICGTIIRII